MIFWISAVLYALIGLVVGRIARNRTMDHWYNVWYAHAIKAFGDRQDVNPKVIAWENAKTYKADNWITAGFLGFAFWPVFVIYFLFDSFVTMLETKAFPKLPKSKTEKLMAQVAQEEAVVKLAESVSLPTKGLRSLE